MQISYHHEQTFQLIALTIELSGGGLWTVVIDTDEAHLLSELIDEVGEDKTDLSFRDVYDLLVTVTGRNLCEY